MLVYVENFNTPALEVPTAEQYSQMDGYDAYGQLITSVADLSASLQENGVVNPIVVHEDCNHVYWVYDGKKRYALANDLQLDLPAVVWIRKTPSYYDDNTRLSNLSEVANKFNSVEDDGYQWIVRKVQQGLFQL